MKLRLALAAVCVAIWAIGGVRPAGAQVATGDSVTGTVAVTQQMCEFIPPSPPVPGFIRCFTPNRYTFVASSGPAGEAATGQVNFATGERSGLVTDVGTVSCLTVTGNRATIGVNFAGFVPFPSEAHAAVIYVEDLGGEAQDKIAVQNLPPGVSAPTVCPAIRPSNVPLQPTYPFEHADFDLIVTDTVARPTTKDQCKNGGWKTFGVFKNQGACVRFVRHQARQACGEERATIGRAAFRAKYGKGKHHRHAMRGCIRTRING